jgi:glycosyltransferase involved in cell wall biosynthesis
MTSVALIISTYNQPGSGEATREIIEKYRRNLDVPVRQVWQEDRGFRKTRILNKAIMSTDADYLVFMDGDCVAHPDFVKEHLKSAKPGTYLNGALIRLSAGLTRKIDHAAIARGDAFRTAWLTVRGRSFNRRYLRLGVAYRARRWLNMHSRTKLYWLGANSSCFRSDAIAVNGFDNRFTYGFEDGDFGNRLENYGIEAKTVRWTANVLHLDHGKPWSSPEVLERNLALQTPKQAGGAFRATEGLAELGAGKATD